jgi:short-subunit dehydrogenase
MERGFAGQVAVVTGASSGIGRALACQLARAGARVGLVARRRGELEELAQVIRAAGGTALVAPADVTDRGQVDAAVAAVRAGLGPIDLMTACAGVGMPTLLDPVNVGDIETMLRVNVLGVVYAFAAVLPEMLRRGSGRLAAVSSLAGYIGLPGESAYCASKAAVNVYLAGLRAQLRGRGVSVTTLCPGFVATPMTAANDFAMPALLSAEAASRRILQAILRRRAVYNFPRRTTALTRLLALLPEWAIARLMARYNATAVEQSKLG